MVVKITCDVDKNILSGTALLWPSCGEKAKEVNITRREK